MKKVDQEIMKSLDSSVRLIPTLADHLISAGGKRLRPMITIAISNMVHSDKKSITKYAAAIELIHSATLLHDDIVDESPLRRGQITANRIWGNSASVLVGDYLFSQAFSLMVAGKSLKALELLSSTAAIITEGEVKQLIALNNLQLSIDDYYQIIQAKTAALFSAACEVNGIIAGLTEQEKTALRQYGTELGIAFQLSDDVLDYQGCTDMMGKTAGDDFSEQKVTLPVLFAWQNSNIEERKFWEQTLKKGEQKKEDFAKAQRIMKKTHALKKTLNLALIHAEKAKKSLEIFPDTLIKSTLEDLALSIVERLY